MAGYRKTEPLGKNQENQSLFMVFMSNKKNIKDSLLICVIELNEARFIKELLWQKYK